MKSIKNLKRDTVEREPAIVNALLSLALEEDIGRGDITTAALVAESHFSIATLTAEETFVLAGIRFIEKIFHMACTGSTFRPLTKDGRIVRKGSEIARIRGKTRGLLAGERTALNLLQRLSGIATITRKYVECVKGLPVKITDTRKTAPGLRYFEKYAVKTGGGTNHRFGLFDGILIKDNHIISAGGIYKAVLLAREKTHHHMKVEIEVKNISEVKNALSAGADSILLDNMSLEKMKRAVEIIRKQKPGVIIEASGNINLHNIKSVASSGVDLISVGALTHSATAVDISMDIKALRGGGNL
jgi:nicotinate-nucleotide pyrophosphorylase (carboxylating)